ncbi:GAF and ANTAR domain-containing protein [Microlunatus lacustris]
MVTEASPGPDLVLASELVGVRQSLQPVLTLTTSIAASTIAAATGAGISLIEDGSRTSTASTNALVELADAQQYELDEGPCLTSWRDSVLIRMDDLEHDSRFPAWTAAARELRLRSVLSTPLRGVHRNRGALKVYSERPYAFGRADEDLLLQIAEQAALLLENLGLLVEVEHTSAAVMSALQLRQRVTLAQGILVGRRGISPEQAFLELAEEGGRRGQTVADYAADVIAGR